VQINQNKIYWDGRDADGNIIGNGLYIYRLLIRGEDGRTVSSLHKMAKVK